MRAARKEGSEKTMKTDTAKQSTQPVRADDKGDELVEFLKARPASFAENLDDMSATHWLLAVDGSGADFQPRFLEVLNTKCGIYVDPKNGGLSPLGEKKFGGNSCIVSAAERHRRLRQQQIMAATISETDICFVDVNSPHPVTIGKLVEHPLNSQIFEENIEENEALIRDIVLHGQLEPIVVNSSYVVISGHRRLRALRALCRTNALIVVVQVKSDEEEEMILAFNLKRHMNNLEKARVYSRYLVIEEKRATIRRAAGKELPENFPKADRGEARDIAARNVRLSGRTAQRGLQVLQAIEAHKGTALPQEIKAVTDAVNRSFLAGEKAAIRHSWIPEVRTKNKQSKATSEAVETAIAVASASVENTPVAKRLLTSSLQTVRRVVGPTADFQKIKALRQYAQSLIILADQLESAPRQQ